METTTLINGWDAFVRSDIYAGAFTEDGERSEELSYYVVCEDVRGARWASKVSFTTEQHWRGEAAKCAEHFLAKVKEALAKGADPRSSSKWVSIQGCYGSAAWGERAELELDARDLESDGYHTEARRFRQDHGLL